MKALVTGCAGFIGSTLCDRLVEDGHDVVGVDSFTPYYDRAEKEQNLVGLRTTDRGPFALFELDLSSDDLAEVIDGVDVVFHQAAQPGVRLSWSDGFEAYVTNNVLATQRLLEAAVAEGVSRLVYASSSSVYGQAAAYPTAEGDLPAPHSPYGVTKLAGEHLCGLYASNWGLATVSLRYFTVYGPRQRPDMAIHRLIEAGMGGERFPLFGDGSSVRDFTYVDDVVEANIAAATRDVPPGTVMNVAGGGEIAMAELIDIVSTAVGRTVVIDHLGPQAGDVRRTGGRIDRAHELLGYSPAVSISEGVDRQVMWHRQRAVR